MKTAANNFRLSLVVALGLLTVTACTRVEQDVQNVPIVVSRHGASLVDVDLLVENAHAIAESFVPGSHLTFFSIVANCQDLSNLRGQVTLFFAQTQKTLFGERISVARVVVDTTQATLSIKVRDETNNYLDTTPLELTGLSASEVAGRVQTHLKSLGTCNTPIVLARSDTDGDWGVRCGPPDKVFIECMKINSTTGDITEQR